MIEIIVIGGGIAGSAAALALAERGAAVNLVEAERPGAAATGASAGMLAPQYESAAPTPFLPLLVESRARYPDFVRRVESLSGRTVPVRWDGMLVANETASEHDGARETIRWQCGEGLRAELLDARDAAALQPGINADIGSWLWFPDEGQVDSQAMATALAPALNTAGVRVITGRRVAAVRSRGGTVTGVILEDGRTLDSDCVIVAAGAWSDTIGGLPRNIPVHPVRGQMLRFPGVAADLSPIVAHHAGIYLVSRDDGTILAGSTMEDVGFDRALTDEGLARIRGAAIRLVPALGSVRPIERWAGLRPISANGLPVLGPDPDLGGLFYATGYGRNGMLFGPLAGQIIADLVLTGTTAYDWRPFACGSGRLGGTGSLQMTRPAVTGTELPAGESRHSHSRTEGVQAPVPTTSRSAGADRP